MPHEGRIAGYNIGMADFDHIFSRAELVDAWRTGARTKFIAFWGHRGRTDTVGPFLFSQWRDAPFTIDDVHYPTAEHYMMAEKARLFGDDERRREIIAARDPGKAKALGRTIAAFDQSAWERSRFGIVVAGNVAKFGQAPMLRNYLLATKGKVLVEASPQDRIWGAGLTRDDPALDDPEQWRGENLLGFALMKARAQLLEASQR